MNMTDLLGTDDKVSTAIPGIETDPDHDINTLYRWAMALVVGVLLGLPIGWLLSYLIFLPFYLGFFFFTLFGLVIGAVVYRVAVPCQPVPRARVRAGVCIVVGVCFGSSLLAEAARFPTDVAEKTLLSIRTLPKGITAEAFRAHSADFARRRLQEVAWPGGIVGYFRWTLASSRLEVPVEGRSRPVIYRAQMYRWWLVVRVMLSLSVLTFGVASQMVGLGPPRPYEPESPGEEA
ncbi:MAG: hypothetical protein IID37_05205 [Planctomycetes bacterium]|nr:hypothetical protein [Planctomycetota bacterium]